jgi:hypothetical protein
VQPSTSFPQQLIIGRRLKVHPAVHRYARLRKVLNKSLNCWRSLGSRTPVSALRGQRGQTDIGAQATKITAMLEPALIAPRGGMSKKSARGGARPHGGFHSSGRSAGGFFIGQLASKMALMTPLTTGCQFDPSRAILTPTEINRVDTSNEHQKTDQGQNS